MLASNIRSYAVGLVRHFVAIGIRRKMRRVARQNAALDFEIAGLDAIYVQKELLYRQTLERMQKIGRRPGTKNWVAKEMVRVQQLDEEAQVAYQQWANAAGEEAVAKRSPKRKAA